MKINEKNNQNQVGPGKESSKSKISEFFKDKRTRWMPIVFIIMIGVTVLQFVLPNIINK